MTKNNKNIVLIGFMGSGKSSSGRKIAADTGRLFIDTDTLIRKRLNENIHDIIIKFGENYFRDVESEICQFVCENENTVISTGGGVAVRTENVRFLREKGIIVYLRASPRHLYENLKNDTIRPLLANVQGTERLKEIERLLEKRKALYESAADTTIDVDGRTIDEIAKEVINKLIIGGNK